MGGFKVKMNEVADGDELFFLTRFMAMYLQFLITSRQMVTSIYNHLQLAA